MLTGQFPYLLDSKARLCFPAPLREQLPEDTLIITKGMDRCLWLFFPKTWEAFRKRLMSETSFFVADSLRVQRRIIAPATELTIDKIGRIAIPQSLREWAGLDKECVILAIENRIEIWDAARYAQWEEKENSDEDFVSAAEKIGGAFTGFSFGDNAYAGAAEGSPPSPGAREG
jgi:MraZ protein